LRLFFLRRWILGHRHEARDARRLQEVTERTDILRVVYDPEKSIQLK